MTKDFTIDNYAVETSQNFKSFANKYSLKICYLAYII